MARLADFWPLSDDELPQQTTPSKIKSANAHNEGEIAGSSISTPVKRDLLPKSAATGSSRKMRRLRRPEHAPNNPLFQPWSAQDDSGTQARSQITMRDSPAKLGLVTEFERDSPPGMTRPARNKAAGLATPTLRINPESELFGSYPSVQLTRPLPCNMAFGLYSTRRQSSVSCGWSIHGAALPLSHEEVNPISPGGTAAEVDSGADDLDDHNHDEGAASKLSPQSTFEVSFPDTRDLLHYSSRDADSVSNRHRKRSNQVRSDGPLKPMSGNIRSPKRTSIKPNDESWTLERKSVTESTKSPSGNMDLSTMFEQMRIHSRETLEGEQPGKSHTMSGHGTSLRALPMELDSPHKQQPIQGTDKFVVDIPNVQTPVDDWNGHGVRQEQVTPKPSVNPAAKKSKQRGFEATKQALAENFLLELDHRVANGQIAQLSASTGGVKIVWTKTLHTTAGRANWRRETVRAKQPDGSIEDVRHEHYASIELAAKVIDDETKLLNVLAHEFSHLATFMISSVTTNPHGKEFKSWASKCSRVFGDRGINVTTKHSYDIDFKYKWECNECGTVYKRHSKSIDIQRHRCGKCKGELSQTKPLARINSRNGSVESGRSEYQLFVKEQMKVVKQENPDVPQRDLLGMVATRWADSKKKKFDASFQVSKNTGMDRPEETEMSAKLMVDLVLGE